MQKQNACTEASHITPIKGGLTGLATSEPVNQIKHAGPIQKVLRLEAYLRTRALKHVEHAFEGMEAYTQSAWRCMRFMSKAHQQVLLLGDPNHVPGAAS